MLHSSTSFRKLVVARWSDVAISFDCFSTHEVVPQNFLGAGHIDVSIPYCFGIDGNHRPVAALPHASRVIDADDALQSGRGGALFQRGEDEITALPRARASGCTNEYMPPVLTHELKLADHISKLAGLSSWILISAAAERACVLERGGDEGSAR